MWETILADEALLIGYDEEGHSKGKMRYEDELPEPPRLKWSVLTLIQFFVVVVVVDLNQFYSYKKGSLIKR